MCYCILQIVQLLPYLMLQFFFARTENCVNAHQLWYLQFKKVNCFKNRCLYSYLIRSCLTISGAVLRSKVVDGRCQVQSPLALVDLTVRSFPWNSQKYGLGSLRETPRGLSYYKRTVGLNPTTKQLTCSAHAQCCSAVAIKNKKCASYLLFCMHRVYMITIKWISNFINCCNSRFFIIKLQIFAI